MSAIVVALALQPPLSLEGLQVSTSLAIVDGVVHSSLMLALARSAAAQTSVACEFRFRIRRLRLVVCGGGGIGGKGSRRS